MKKTLILTTALVSFGFAANADVTVMSWGGAYGAAQTEGHVKPWSAATGNAAIMVDSDNPAPAIKAMVEAGNVTVDVASVEYADAIRLCDEGLLEPIDAAALPAGADGTAAADDFFPGAVTECAVSTDIWSNVFAYDTSKFPEGPTTAADFFDLEKFPGKRGLKKGAKAVLEFALLGDGVPAADVYTVLSTPEGVDRAFAKLDTIKAETVWWEAGAQAPQLLADGEVAMTTAYNGRIFAAAVGEGRSRSSGTVRSTKTKATSCRRGLRTRTWRWSSSSTRPRPKVCGLRLRTSPTARRASRPTLSRSSMPVTARPRWVRTCRPTRPT
jgi:putative spermidine/putrescine transport system substrate-binding protein